MLCARASIRDGVASGLAIGAGAALVDVGYAALGVAGAATLLDRTGLRTVLGLVGVAFLIWLGARAFRVSLLATAANPMTIASWAAIFAAASAAAAVAAADTPAFLAGIGLGSLGWFTLLATTLGLLRRRVGPTALRVVDAVSGLGLVGFGGALALRVVA